MPDRARGTRRGARMSNRERKTLMLIVRGYKAAAIAEQLGVTTNYVYAIARLLRARFDAKTNAELISQAIAEGVISPDGEFLTVEET